MSLLQAISLILLGIASGFINMFAGGGPIILPQIPQILQILQK